MKLVGPFVMDIDQDYYAVLGVPRDAPDAEIRRAFRAKAKELHPDRKITPGQDANDEDFQFLTEAYETLRDPSRRNAYDDELIRARQLAAPAKSKSNRAFAKGLAAGLFLAVAAIGAKVYLDRNLGSSKSQESLRLPKEDRLAVVEALKPPSGEETSRNAGRQPGAGGGEEAKSFPRQTRESAEAIPAPRLKSQQPAGNDEGSPELATDPRSASVQSETGSIGVESEGRLQLSLRPRPAQSQTSAFADAVLSLEGTLSSGANSVAAYRLVSLVNSSTALPELAEAASKVKRPETQELIHARIATLTEEQRRQAQFASSAPSQTGPLSATGAARLKAGAIEVAVGPRPKESVLYIIPGNGSNESFSDCPSCPEMAVVPGGQAIVGSNPETVGFRPDEAPAHRIALKKPIAISKHWVSASNWRACVEAGVCRPTLSSFLAAGPDVSATRVSWFDAKAYADWLSHFTGRRYRLLSEAEWEYAASQGQHRSDSPAQSDAAPGRVMGDGGIFRFGKLRRFAGMKPNAWGLYSIPGTALEWVEDCWHPNYNQAPADGSAWLAGTGGDCAYRIVRGGAAAPGGEFEERRAVARAREFADARAPTLGFRVARELSQPAKPPADALSSLRGKTARGD